MARKTGESVVLIDAAGKVSDTPEPEPTESEIYELEKLSSILGELGSDDERAKVTIWAYRKRESGGRGAGRDTYLATMTPSEFSNYGLEGVRDDYGPGEYRIRINAANGDFMHNGVYSIGPAPASKRAANPAPVFSPNNGAVGLETAFSKLADSMQNGFTQLAMLLSKQGTDRRAMLEEMQLYKNLFSGGNQSPIAGNPIEMMKSALDIAKDFAGNASGKESTTADVFLKLAEQFAPAFVEVVKNMKQQQPIVIAAPTEAQQPKPSPAPVAIAAPAPSPESQDMDLLGMAIKQYLPMFLAQAQQGNDPYKYADMICDLVPLDKVQTFVARADWFEYLLKLNPAVANFRPWFEQLRNHLVEILTQEAEPSISNPIDGISTHDPFSGEE